MDRIGIRLLALIGRQRAQARGLGNLRAAGGYSLNGRRTDTRVIRKNTGEIRDALNQLDERAAHSSADNHRRAERYTYRVDSLVVEFPQANEGSVRHTVPSRNISRDGVAFLLGNFVYPGTACQIHLVNVNQNQVVAAGKVVRCRYLEGSANLYEVGVRLDRPIDPALFHRGAAKIRMLVADNDPAMHRLISYFLKTENVELTFAESGHQVVELANLAFFDLILLDMELPEPDGLQVAQDLRAAGYLRPIIAMTARSSPDARDRCTASGCTVCFAKPITRDTLLQLVHSHIEEPLISSLADDPEMAGLINDFVKELPTKVRQLHDAHKAKDLATLERCARTVKGEAGAFGFERITEAATSLEAATAKPDDVDALRERLEQLVRLCGAARLATFDPAEP